MWTRVKKGSDLDPWTLPPSPRCTPVTTSASITNTERKLLNNFGEKHNEGKIETGVSPEKETY